MACHDDLDSAVDIDIYFANPHGPPLTGERLSNKRFNSSLRHYVGKGTNHSVYSQYDLDVISYRINAMPRRILQ